MNNDTKSEPLIRESEPLIRESEPLIRGKRTFDSWKANL
jgi:hypothetical protein